MIKRLYIVILFIILFTTASLTGEASTYLVVVNVKIKIKEKVYISCTKTVQERQKGRWVYLKKAAKCPQEVENWKSIEVKDVFKGENQREARKRAIDFYKERGYKIVKVSSIKIIR